MPVWIFCPFLNLTVRLLLLSCQSSRYTGYQPVLCQIMSCECFFPVCGLSCLLSKYVEFWWSLIYPFFFHLWFCFLCPFWETFAYHEVTKICSTGFFFENFIVLAFMFSLVIHLKLILVYGVRSESRLIFFLMDSCCSTIFEKIILPSLDCFVA